MKINELPSTIERIWNFIVPSIVEFLIAILIVTLVVGNAPLHAMFILLRPYINILKDPEVIKLLSAYGIIKLTPVILLFILILVAYAFDKVAHLIGGLLPITLVWDPHAMMTKKVSAYLVTDIWKYYPNIDNVADLHRIIGERLERAKLENDPLFATAIFFDKRFKKLHAHLNYIQFLVIETVIITGIWVIWMTSDWRTVILNALIVIILLLIVYALYVRQQFTILEGLEFYRVFNMRTSLQVQMEKPIQPNEEKRLNLRKKCEAEFEDAQKDKVITLHWKWK